MNKIVQLLRDGTMQRLIIKQGASAEIPAGGSFDLDLPIDLNKILLKSIEVTCSKNTEFRVEFFEEPTRTNSRYSSDIVKQEAYDVLDLPYVDKQETETMYFRIHNTSQYAASFTVEVRGLELK